MSRSWPTLSLTRKNVTFLYSVDTPTSGDKRMTRRRQLSHDCCIDLSPKVFVRRTSLTTIQQLVKGLKKGDDRVKEEPGQGTSGEKDKKIKEENQDKDNKQTNGEGKDNPIEHLTPSQFSDANEIRRAISLNNIWKVNFFCNF